MGIRDVVHDALGIVLATLPGNKSGKPTIAWIAHVADYVAGDERRRTSSRVVHTKTTAEATSSCPATRQR